MKTLSNLREKVENGVDPIRVWAPGYTRYITTKLTKSK